MVVEDGVEDAVPPSRKWLRRLWVGVPVVLLVLLVALLGLAAVLLFAGDKVFVALWPTLDKKLSAQGIYVEIGAVDQVGGRGLVLSEVVLFKDAARRSPLATLSDIAVKARFFEKRVGAIGAQVSFADARLQVFTGDTDPVLGSTGGELLVGIRGMAIDGFRTRHGGIHLGVSGVMEWVALQGSAAGGETGDTESAVESEQVDMLASNLARLDAFVRWLEVRKSGGSPLHLAVAFSGSAEQAPAADLTVTGKDLEWRGVPLRIFHAEMHVDLAEGARRGELRALHLGYREGDLNAAATYDFDTRYVEVEKLRCDIDLIRLIAEVYPSVAESMELVSYPAPPEWFFSGSVEFGDDGNLDIGGQVVLPEGLSIGRGDGAMELAELSLTIQLAGDELRVTPLRVGYCGGLFAAEIVVRPFVEPVGISGSIITERPLSNARLSEVLGFASDSDGELSLAASWSGDLNTLQITALEIARGEGTLRGEVDLDLVGRVAHIKSLHSDLDLLGLLGELMPSVRESLAVVSEAGTPELKVEGSVAFTDLAASDLTVRIDIEDGCVLELGESGSEPLVIDTIGATVVLRDGEVLTDDLGIDLLGGKVGAKLAARPFGEEFSMSGTIGTLEGLPISALADALGGGSGSAELLTFDIEWGGGLEEIEVPTLVVGQGKKRLQAAAGIDLAAGRLRLDKLSSNLDLIELARALVPGLADKLAMVTSASGPTLEGSGSVDLGDPVASDLRLQVASVEGFVLDIDGKPLALSQLVSNLEMKGRVVTTKDFSVEVLGGVVRADVAARPFDPAVPFQIGLLIDQLAMQQIADLVGSEKKTPGTASMNFGGSGSLSLAALSGEGNIDVADTELYALPLLGRVFSEVNSLNLGLRDREAGYVRGPFTIERGVISTGGIELLAASMKMRIPGTVDLANEQIGIKVHIIPSGVVGLAAGATTGSIEVDVNGPLAAPKIRLGLSGGIAGLAEDALGVTGEMVGGAVGGAVGGVVGGVRHVIPGVASAPEPPPSVELDSATPEKKTGRRGFFGKKKG